MKVLVQRLGTKEFLSRNGVWSADPAEALVFDHSYLALNYCNQHRLSDAQIVLKFEDDRYSLYLPMTGGSGAELREE
jgi:hypothetical protein